MKPEGWAQLSLGDLADFIGRGAAPKYVDQTTGVFAVSQKCVRDGKVVSIRARAHDSSVTVKPQAMLRPGDICVNSTGTGTLGRVGIWLGTPSGIYFADTHVTVVRAKEHIVVPRFLLEALLSSPLQRAIADDCATGSTNQIELSRRRFAALSIALPPLPEQRKIAAILAAVDKPLEKTEAVIARLQDLKQAMMQELLTRGLPGRQRAVVPLNEEWRLGRLAGVRQIPVNWMLVRLTSVARLESGHTPSRQHPEYWGGDVPWVSLHDSKSLDVPEIFKTELTITPKGLANSSARLLPSGTVVFSRTATIGKSTVLGREMATSQDFANYVCGDQLHNRYLMHLFRHMGPEWKRLMAGSTHKTIYMPVFRDLQVLLPPIEEQKKIAQIADGLESRLEEERATVNSMIALKSALQHALLTGAVRVPPDSSS